MKKKILIIGKKSFVTSILKEELKKYFFIKIIDFENFLRKKEDIKNLITLLIVHSTRNILRKSTILKMILIILLQRK